MNVYRVQYLVTVCYSGETAVLAYTVQDARERLTERVQRRKLDAHHLQPQVSRVRVTLEERNIVDLEHACVYCGTTDQVLGVEDGLCADCAFDEGVCRCAACTTKQEGE